MNIIQETYNGANVIILSSNGDELVMVRHAYGEGKLALPGGRVYVGETSCAAASRESFEETGLTLSDQELRYIGEWAQRPQGLVKLYEAVRYGGKLREDPDEEIAEVKWVKFDMIWADPGSVGLGYYRMIAQYLRCVRLLDPTPFEGVLARDVLWPAPIIV